MKYTSILFDFDGTLVYDDSFMTFARHALGWSTWVRKCIKSLPTIIKWKLGKITNSQAKEEMFTHLYCGISSQIIAEKAKTFAPRYNQAVLNRLKWHLRNNDKVYIISASLDLWLKKIANDLGVNLLCTIAEINSSGIITGRFATPNCHGSEKSARFLATEPNRQDYTLIVYGDSAGDANLWAIADEAINVRTQEL